ncbi:MAG: 8-oxo-dGTP diphosphatase [Acholeplasmatales bacterium]|jgi:8-oxo-dGTP pyrophosphatase MutT (NUDIX family)|nr:8-oxo-dGTP diphosphatase [Acholeplasmatales bacterium]
MRTKLKDVTNMLFIKDKSILLGMKKRGFGKGKYNGFGGKLEKNETILQAALREAYEESTLVPTAYYKAAIISFYKPYNMRVHLYICTKWENTEKETEEMLPKWFSFEKIPYDTMWDDDKYWLPLVLDGKRVRAKFIFNKNVEDEKGIIDNKCIRYSITTKSKLL